MAELDEISRVQGIKWGVHGVQTLFFRVHQAALDTYIDLIAHNTRMQGLNFGVHIELLQIFLCVQLPRSADWQAGEPFEHGHSINALCSAVLYQGEMPANIINLAAN